METETENNLKDKLSKNLFCERTPLSKYLAMALFIAMPFIGGWVGYQYGYRDSMFFFKEMSTKEKLSQNAQNSVNSSSIPQNIGGNFFTLDKKAVYLSTAQGFVEIEGIDASKAKVIDDYYVIKDDKAVYTNCSGKFEPLMHEHISPHAPSFDVVEWPYFKDDYNVFFLNARLDGESPAQCHITVLENADPKTFQVFDGGIDKTCAWYVVGDLDPYRPIYYVKDANHVYCADKVVENADPFYCTNEDASGCEYRPPPKD